MSRGRKAKVNNSNLGWQQVFSKNVGKYLQYAIIELGKVENHATETGQDLLKRIKEEKGKNKKEKELPAIKASEIPYEIPRNWVWCRLGEMSINCDGARIPVSQAEREKKEKIYDYYGASGKIDKIDGYTHNGKYLLIGEDGANLIAKSTPIAFIVQGKFWVNNHAHVLDFVDDTTTNFMVHCLNSLDINPFITGGFQPKLSQGNLNLIPIPLPPLSEQQKIVDFLTDFENENLKEDGYYFNQEVEQKVIALHEAQLKGVELATELTHQLTLVKKLRQQLLQDAVQGKLVPQNTTDEPASELLQKIKAEKAQLIAAKKIKKDKELPAIKPEEIPFEIPENWVWCRLGEVIELNSGQDLAPHQYSDTDDSGLPYVTGASNLQKGEVIINRWTNTPKSFAINGDLLFTCKGSGIGKMAYLKIDKVHIARQIMSIRSLFILIKYIETILLNNVENFRLNAKSSIPGIDRAQILKLLIPLPPLPEQTRIVQKLDELMQYCNDLEASIQASQSQNEMLLQQLLREALEVRVVGGGGG